MTRKIQGPFTAVVTPFDGDGEVDPAVLRRQVARQVGAGNSIFCGGTNGEFFALSAVEKMKIAGTCVEAAEGRSAVVAHIGEPSTLQTIKLGREVEKLGVDAVAVITPSVLPCSQEELFVHYSTVADALTVPVLMYNLPARTGNVLKPDTVARLSQHPNIAGIKDSGGTQESLDGFLPLVQGRSDFLLLVGPDHLVAHGLLNGAAGCVSGLGNLAPYTVNAMYAAFKAGNIAELNRLQAEFITLRRDLYGLGFAPVVVKRALRHAMPEVGECRLPVQISAEVDAQIKVLADRYFEPTANSAS